MIKMPKKYINGLQKPSKLLAAVALAVIAIGLILYFGKDWLEERFFSPTGSRLEQGVRSDGSQTPQAVAQNLSIPWEIAFLPDGDLLVTERSGSLKRIGKNQQTYSVEGVEHVGEGGLLGLALHPNFERNRQLYLYLTTKSGSGLTNRVERYRLVQDQLADRTVIIENIPGAANHDGGRMAFGPDGYLYITTGDAGQEPAAQDTGSLAGKILRLSDDGKIPADNPFKNAVYSYGHRNPQGLTWDNRGRLWATEHGRSGLRSGFDELNLIKQGANYGWPVIEGDESRPGMERPIAHSGADETWAPAGLTYYDGSLFFGGLRGQSLYQANIDNHSVSLLSHFSGDFGRLRAVVIGPDNLLYVSTSNTDGRGNAAANDDKIIRIDPSVF